MGGGRIAVERVMPLIFIPAVSGRRHQEGIEQVEDALTQAFINKALCLAPQAILLS
jgi:hypothetical protein